MYVGYYNIIIIPYIVLVGRTVENRRAVSRDERPAAEIDNDRNDVRHRENLTRGIIIYWKIEWYWCNL